MHAAHTHGSLTQASRKHARVRITRYLYTAYWWEGARPQCLIHEELARSHVVQSCVIRPCAWKMWARRFRRILRPRCSFCTCATVSFAQAWATAIAASMALLTSRLLNH
jgi:hypothetical protein